VSDPRPPVPDQPPSGEASSEAAGTATWSPQPSPSGGEPSGPPSRRWGSIGLGLVLVAVGVVWLLAQLGLDLRWELLLPVALIVVGALVLVSPLWRGGDGLIGLGIVLSIMALLFAVAPGASTFSAGDRMFIPTDVAELEASYGLGAGTLTIDLRGLDLPAGTTAVRAGVNLGELAVIVPADATVDGRGRVVMGEVSAFGRSSGGIAPRADLTDAGDDAQAVLELDLRVGLGRIEVTR
jgi:hypothetical protein